MMKCYKNILSTICLTVFFLGGAPALYAAGPGHQHRQAAKGHTAKHPPMVFSSPQKVGTRATCPVTKESFTIGKNTLSSTYKGHYVYFCCAGCKPKFDAHPGHYLTKTHKKK